MKCLHAVRLHTGDSKCIDEPAACTVHPPYSRGVKGGSPQRCREEGGVWWGHARRETDFLHRKAVESEVKIASISLFALFKIRYKQFFPVIGIYDLLREDGLKTGKKILFFPFS